MAGSAMTEASTNARSWALWHWARSGESLSAEQREALADLLCEVGFALRVAVQIDEACPPATMGVALGGLAQAYARLIDEVGGDG